MPAWNRRFMSGDEVDIRGNEVRHLVDANRLGTRGTRFYQLRLHVLFFQRLDRVPIQVEFPGEILDRRRTTTQAHVMGKALGVERVVGQELESLAFHLAATSALHTLDLDFEVDTRIAAGKIAHLARPPVVPAHVRSATTAAACFFERRTRVMTRAFGSPKTPRTVGCERYPGKAYASHSRRIRFVEVTMKTCSQFRPFSEMPKSPYLRRFQLDSTRQVTHTTS